MKRSGTGPPPDGGLRVLTVFADTAHRALVTQTCARIASESRVVDAATATDAVLVLLSQRIDLLLIDVAWAGELLGALEHHARRSAPHALIMAFGAPSAHGASRTSRGLGLVRPWEALVLTLEARIGRGASPSAESLPLPP